MRERSSISRGAWLLAALGLCLYWAAGVGAASQIRVGDACSLAEAIDAANSDEASGGCPAGSEHDRIILSGALTLSEALPAIRSQITIDGGGHALSGGGQFRIFDVQGGELLIRNLTVSGGKSQQDGGGLRLGGGARVRVENAIFRDNEAANGGAIALTSADDQLEIHGSRFASNRSEGSAGAILAHGGTIRVTESQFHDNCAKRVTTILSQAGDSDHRVLDADGCAHITYTRAKIDDAIKPESGGAIEVRNEAALDIDRSSFSGNKATQGGAIAGTGSGNLTIRGSSFAENAAQDRAGAVFAADGAVRIDASSFVKNAARNGGGAISVRLARLDIRNSAFSENFSEHGAGALQIGGTTTVDVTHATFVDNWSRYQDSGALETSLGAIVNLRNSIVESSGDAEDCVGGLGDSSGSLSRDGSCADATTPELLLGELTGSPAHYPLLDHSPAVDNADPDYCLETDQLGNPRPAGGGCDVGAIESLTALPAEATPTPQVCTLHDKISAANTNRAVGACPAGTDHDVITFTQDITLEAALPAITSTITIEGNGFAISGNNKFRIFDVNRGRLTINNLTLAKGSRNSADGGAIRLQGGSHVVVNDSRFIRNYADNGGAIGLTSRSERLTVRDSFFYSNSAGRNGGALNLDSGIASISGSSFVENRAGHDGGGIRIMNHGRLTLENSSLIRDRASWKGNAISLENGSVANITHATVANAFAAGSGFALYVYEPGYLSASKANLRNSIIAGQGAGLLCHGDLAQNDGNLIQRGCPAKLSDDPLFAEPVIDDATGAPLYLPLGEDSPALDAADPQFCLPADQIGAGRPRTDACDIGAIESEPIPLPAEPLAPCKVTTTARLNFRDAPGGNFITQLIRGQTLRATGFAPGWFNVILDGVSGWISADYVTTQGDCA